MAEGRRLVNRIDVGIYSVGTKIYNIVDKHHCAISWGERAAQPLFIASYRSRSNVC